MRLCAAPLGALRRKVGALGAVGNYKVHTKPPSKPSFSDLTRSLALALSSVRAEIPAPAALRLIAPTAISPAITEFVAQKRDGLIERQSLRIPVIGEQRFAVVLGLPNLDESHGLDVRVAVQRRQDHGLQLEQ